MGLGRKTKGGIKLKIAFISGPYRATNGKTVLENIRHAEKYAIKYWQLGYAVICPHLNTAFFDGLAEDHVWIDGDIEILKRCDVIVMIPGFDHSLGSVEELKIARDIGLEIIFED